MDEDLLDEIYVNNERDEECLRVLLEVWLQKSTNPTWKNVTNALAKIGKNHCISDKSQCMQVPISLTLNLANNQGCRLYSCGFRLCFDLYPPPNSLF